MIKELSIDLETYSDVDISKCGAYKYAESDNFEILLFGVSVDNGPVVVYDLTAGNEIPTEILEALSDENIIKWAFNASFESDDLTSGSCECPLMTLSGLPCGALFTILLAVPFCTLLNLIPNGSAMPL